METRKNEPLLFKADVQIRVVLYLLVSVIVILIGQAGRELLSPDDLREVEVAREMYVSGDYVIPHLAGLPFVEKPSGFPAVVATIYDLIGGPSADAARYTSTAFALASLIACFLLGRRILGIEGGALATATLALSERFCRTAHEVLLDNAFTAAIAFTVLFAWMALETDILRKKHIAYAGALFSLGLSFLFKGFIGVAIFGSGFFLYLVLSKRFSELRHILNPLPVMAFLFPFLSWTIPFFMHAASDLVREFFINNHWGRFISGYISHHRPFYFYIVHIWADFAPGGIILLLAIWEAWKTRQEHEYKAGLFLLCLIVGPLMVLSASVANESVYILPAHPAMAILVAWSIMKGWSSPGRTVRILSQTIATVAILVTGIMLSMTVFRGGTDMAIIVAVFIFVLALVECVRSIWHNNLQWIGVCTTVLFALSWGLWFTGPLAEADIAQSSIRQPMMQALRLAGDEDILLHRCDDGIRGAAGFYRNQTAQEFISPAKLVAELVGNASDTDSDVALVYWFSKNTLPPELQKAAQDAGVNLHIKAHVKCNNKYLLLVSADTTIRGEKITYYDKISDKIK